MTSHPSLSTEKTISTNNFILKSLPKEDYDRLLPDLELVEFPLGKIIYRAEEPIEYVYFPNNSMVSVIAQTIEGQCAEVGVIGREGMTGIDVLMGVDYTLNENIIQHADGGLRIKTEAIRREFNRGGALHDLLLNFTRLFIIQISQTALCNRLHTIEERLARWLLFCQDRAETNELQLTQDFLAIMLGTNRATVTISAISLQSAGFISYSRGKITITDREGLKYFSCACYQTVKAEYDRRLK